MKTRLLISGLGGSLFPYLHNKLANAGYEMFYIDSNPALANIYPGLNFFQAPLVNEEIYSSFIDELIEKQSIDVYIPLIDEEIIKAKQKEETRNGKKLIVVTPSSVFSELCLNKKALMRQLASKHISEIETYPGDEFNWQFVPPVFVKPISGRGSRGVLKVNTKEELNAYYVLEKYAPSEVIIQPFIRGVEYTVGVVVNKNNQMLSISSKRVLIKKGITISAVTENNDLIKAIAEKINKAFLPAGPYNIQLFVTAQNEVKIFEINPRFSTTLVLSYEAGLDELSLYLDHLNDNSATVLEPKEDIHLYRLWNNIFY